MKCFDAVGDNWLTVGLEDGSDDFRSESIRFAAEPVERVKGTTALVNFAVKELLNVRAVSNWKAKVDEVASVGELVSI